MIKGSLVALVTPMYEDGTIDWEKVDFLVNWHIQEGTDAIVVAGTTGECTTLTFEEHFKLIERVVSLSNKKIPIIAGTGSNSIHEALFLTKKAVELGVDACLLTTPYYNKPTQEGLYQYFSLISDSVDIPLILYNVPSRTVVDLLPETVERLSKKANIIGIKEATGIVDRCSEILQRCGADFIVYSGDDETGLQLLKEGASGVISVTANVFPNLMAKVCQLIFSDQIKKAEQINQQLDELHVKLFTESNPIPVKWLLADIGLIKFGIRLPLTLLDSKYHDDLRKAYHQVLV